MSDLHNRQHDPDAYALEGEGLSYWRDSAVVPQFLFQQLSSDQVADCVVVGGGVTGLNAALRLAGRHQRKVALLDSAYPGWGASGRSFGFCGLGGGFFMDASRQHKMIVKKLGEAEAIRFGQSQVQALAFLKASIRELGADAQIQGDGELVLAHSPAQAIALREQASFYASTLSVGADFLSSAHLLDHGMHHRGQQDHCLGGLHIKAGFGLHPLRYSMALATACHQAGADLYGQSDVIAISPERDGRVRVHTSLGSVLAKQVLVATNGYTSQRSAPSLAGCSLPVLAHALVTPPLSEARLQAQGWWSDVMTRDARRLPYFFRLLPGGRMLFGVYGGLWGSWDASRLGEEQFAPRLRAAFAQTFPAWADLEPSHFWSGLTSFHASGLPHIGPVAEMPGVWTAQGYHGRGMALGAWAGAQIADIMAAKRRYDALPLAFRMPLNAYPFPALQAWAMKAGLLALTTYDRWR
ncbi:MAG: FAD-binding oxidoreductase [Cohaesibacter sp.]|jgi:glycine/D-amino acid oxidase-like deaminating enzyme|nr:FAD-binding oxidoreductase [Cohaesibacter sp.]